MRKHAIDSWPSIVHALLSMRPTFRLFLLLLPGISYSPLQSQDLTHLALESEFASFVEEDFPFFTQVIDAREFGDDAYKTNLTPRGIVVKLGDGHFGCFDPDLLRWSLFWKANEKGEYLTMDGMAPGSYRLPNRKSPAGQESLPKPLGSAIAASPNLPGWWSGDNAPKSDPRDRGNADDGEVGLGPLEAKLGRFSGIRLSDDDLLLEYTIGNVAIVERISFVSERILRHVGFSGKDETPFFLHTSEGWAEIPESAEAVLISIDEEGNFQIIPTPTSPEATPADRRWRKSVEVSHPDKSSEPVDQALTFDDLPVPVPNPWKRNVRLAGFDFFPDGRAVFAAFDGDIWIAEGLEEGSRKASWSRFASGLHEPKSVCIVNDEIYVSDRNGIVRLHDLDDNGEADWYENFSNIVGQTGESREFAMDMVATNDGAFILAKGGQVGTTRGRHNGMILKVAPDGRSYEVIATGLRQPYLGYNTKTGVLTSSDQQGHWKPATPIYQIEAGKYYGFQPAKEKENAVHPAPISDPELWIPHFINQSGAGQVWMHEPAEMGPLNGELVHIGYNRPELFKIYLNESREQGAVFPLLDGFPSGILKGRVHPKDGRLYVSGFEIWGTSADRITGVFRIRPTGARSWIPTQIEAAKRGILLSFENPVSPDVASVLNRYSVDRWNYRQTHNYGSGNFTLSGEPGQESFPVASVKLSTDNKTLFLGIPDMQPAHSIRVTYRRPEAESTAIDIAYLTARSFPEIDLTENGFADNEVNLKVDPSLTKKAEKITPTIELGRKVSLQYGCIACHATGESPVVPANTEGAQVAVGPAWTGLWNSKRTFTDGSFIKSVDSTYLRESILDPGRRVAEGYDTVKTGVGMPSYLGVLKDHEIDSIILYIESLKKK